MARKSLIAAANREPKYSSRKVNRCPVAQPAVRACPGVHATLPDVPDLFPDTGQPGQAARGSEVVVVSTPKHGGEETSTSR